MSQDRFEKYIRESVKIVNGWPEADKRALEAYFENGYAATLPKDLKKK